MTVAEGEGIILIIIVALLAIGIGGLIEKLTRKK